MKNYFYRGTKNLLDERRKTNEHESQTDKKDQGKDDLDFIKDFIKGFFDMKNVCFLFGSGTSVPAIPTMNELYSGLKSSECFNDTEEKQLSGINDEKNIEKLLSVLYSYRVFLESSKIVDGVKTEESITYKLVCNCINKIERHVFHSINVSKEEENYNCVMKNYETFYSKLVFRNKDLSRLCVFTTNNDLFNERAMDKLNIHYIDGFAGGLKRYFNPAMFNYSLSKRLDTSINKYEPVENMVYLYKLHGSVNWIEDNNRENTYFNIRELSDAKDFDPSRSYMIYPNALKQTKSLGAPYVDIFREFQHKLLEPNIVLFVIGYSFGDEHINDIIYRALATNSSINLVIINKLDDNKTICNINDGRIYRIWSDISNENEDEGIPLHYFSTIVNELLPIEDSLARDKERKLIENFIRSISDSTNNL